jgi:type II secretion system protein I
MNRRLPQSRTRMIARRGGGGFTLIEVLVTMALMAVVLPVTMRGISVAIATASSARHRAEAATLAQSKLTEIVADVTMMGETSQMGSAGNFGAAWPDYSYTTLTSDDAELGLSHLTIVVSWIERGKQRTFTASTMVQYPEIAVGTIETSG